MYIKKSIIWILKLFILQAWKIKFCKLNMEWKLACNITLKEKMSFAVNFATKK